MRSRHWRERNRAKKRRGTVLVYVAVTLAALVGLSALTLDLGRMIIARQQAQEIMDAAVLAGGFYLTGDASSTLVNTASGVPSGGDGIAAKSAKWAAVANNEAMPQWSTRTVGTLQPGVTVTFPPYPAQQGVVTTDTGAQRNVHLGEVIRAQGVVRVPMTFGQILGLQNVDVQASATAILNRGEAPQEVTGNPLPFAIADTTIWDKSTNPPTQIVQMGDTVTLKVTNPKDEDNFIGNGNFLAVSFPGDHGANDFRARIAGTADPVTFDLTNPVELYSKPGNMTGPTEQGLNARFVGDPYPYPSANNTAWNDWLNSYNPMTGARTVTKRLGLVPIVLDPGGNLHGRSSLQLIGFAGVFIEGFETVGNGNNAVTRLTARIVRGFYSLDDIKWVGAGSDPPYGTTLTTISVSILS